MHDQVVCRNIKPFQELAQRENFRVIGKEFFVVEPDHIIIVYVMPKMLVTNVLVGTISGSAQPGQKAAERRIVTDTLEYEIVAAFVNQVGGNGHGMGQQQSCADIHKHTVGK